MMDDPMEILPLPPAARAGPVVVQTQRRTLEAMPALRRILNALPSLTMILNRERQVVLANQKLADFSGAVGMDQLCGFRPGEILQCARSLETGNGCGAARHCAVCGALHAILGAQAGRAETRICRLVRRTASGEQPIELEVSAAPIQIAGEHFTVVCATDISGRLRREWRERQVAPQALELALEMEALSSTLAANPTLQGELVPKMAAASRRVASLVREHAELTSAEAGDLAVLRARVPALPLLRAAAGDLEYQEAAQDRRVRIDASSRDADLDTDPDLARRAFARLILNALEATPSGGAVTLGCRPDGVRAEIWVHNAGEMTPAVQLQVFQRSFSTKGEGRGYGAYFSKLVVERYLGGSLTFNSTREGGTTFSIVLPVLSVEAS
jgi:signal transduction histidine kinase